MCSSDLLGSFFSPSYYSTSHSSLIPSHSTLNLSHISLNSYMNPPSPHLPPPHLPDLTSTHFYLPTPRHQHTQTSSSPQLFLSLQPPLQLPIRVPQPHYLPHLPNHHPTRRPLLTVSKQTPKKTTKKDAGPTLGHHKNKETRKNPPN